MKNNYSSGKECYLRTPELNDADSEWYQWFSNPDVTKFLVDQFWPNSVELQKSFIKSAQEDRNRLLLLICDIETDSIIGVAALNSINWVQRYADLSIVQPKSNITNGNQTYEAMTIMLEIAFNKLNLLNIKSYTVELNDKSLLLQKLLGFKQIGSFENLVNIGGIESNLVCLQLSKKEWEKRQSSS